MGTAVIAQSFGCGCRCHVACRSAGRMDWDIEDRQYHLEAGATYPIEIFLNAPPDSKEKAPQMLKATAIQNGATRPSRTFVYPEYNDVPE